MKGRTMTPSRDWRDKIVFNYFILLYFLLNYQSTIRLYNQPTKLEEEEKYGRNDGEEINRDAAIVAVVSEVLLSFLLSELFTA